MGVAGQLGKVDLSPGDASVTDPGLCSAPPLEMTIDDTFYV
jgi:hypothetical protein